MSTDLARSASVSASPLELPASTLHALETGTLQDPFSALGPHPGKTGGIVVRAYLPGADSVQLLAGAGQTPVEMLPIQTAGLFAAELASSLTYRFRIQWPNGPQETEDPYAFGLLLGELDLHLFAEGNHRRLGVCLGAQAMTVDGVPGVRFAVWAPNARRASVVGDFNGWDGRRHAMRLRYPSGIWELFVPRLEPGTIYKYELLGPHGVLPLKADPVALAAETPPLTASVVARPDAFSWSDEAWMEHRAQTQSRQSPISIYEVHVGSWQRDGNNGTFGWQQLGERLIPYVQEMGFTHLELLPIMEHPFGGSWGYQPLSQFAPSGRYGPPEQFAAFVNACHRSGIGVILDWVPAHFPTDPHGIAQFDGTALYEHADPREGFHQDWNTLIFNLGRREVHGFMLASALHWLEKFHVDGLRVDAVASMLYRDYSRKQGEWVPNMYGGRENLESIDFLRHLNDVVHETVPGALVYAEESTAWPGVTQSTSYGGLGFDYKWNMGWMHDTLHYIEHDPVYRAYEHGSITFGLVYAFSERFVLPVSHDEVVHGKGSLIAKMPGDHWQRFANLRAYFGLMWTHPGKKLLFMGCELAQEREWNHDEQLDWYLLQDPMHQGVQQLIRDLNRLYRELAALHVGDADQQGFQWVIGNDSQNSVFAYLRHAPGMPSVLVVLNMTPVPRQAYRIGVTAQGRWSEVLNSDAGAYGGSNLGNGGSVCTEAIASHGQAQSLSLLLPPLAALILKHEA